MKLVLGLLMGQRHFVHFLMKTGLTFFTWLERKRMEDLMFVPKNQKFIIQYKCKI